jgi:membrane protease YdiL (CAAX protease family)
MAAKRSSNPHPSDTPWKTWVLTLSPIGIAMLYFLLFLLTWTLLVLALLPNSETVRAITKLPLYILPIVLYAREIQRSSALAFLKLDRGLRQRWPWTLIAMLFFALYPLALGWIQGNPEFHRISFLYFGAAVLVAPLTEEVVFRGFLLSTLDQQLPFWPANLLQAAMFCLSHVPSWIARGASLSVLDVVWVTLFGAVAGLLYKKSGSLWTCVLIHATNNLAQGLF